MLTKNQTKRILSLYQKKNRLKYKLFVAEGPKVVQEFLDAGYQLDNLYTDSNSFHSTMAPSVRVSTSELNKISRLKTPNSVLAVFKIPKPSEIDHSGLILALDGINDPGNLGTIIRLCDWFGIKDLICSHNSVDCYNPKVIQSAMGSHTRVNVSYVALEDFLESDHKTFGTFMDGVSIYELDLPSKGIIVMGNEANGISTEIESKIDLKLAIPRYGKLQQTESLNVANAAAIILSEFRRRSIEM